MTYASKMAALHLQHVHTQQVLRFASTYRERFTTDVWPAVCDGIAQKVIDDYFRNDNEQYLYPSKRVVAESTRVNQRLHEMTGDVADTDWVREACTMLLRERIPLADFVFLKSHSSDKYNAFVRVWNIAENFSRVERYVTRIEMAKLAHQSVARMATEEVVSIDVARRNNDGDVIDVDRVGAKIIARAVSLCGFEVHYAENFNTIVVNFPQSTVDDIRRITGSADQLLKVAVEAQDDAGRAKRRRNE